MTNVGGRDEELKSTGYEIFIGFPLHSHDPQRRPHLPGRRSEFGHGHLHVEWAIQLHLPGDFAYRCSPRTPSPAITGSSVGGSPGWPAVPAGEGATNLPAHASFRLLRGYGIKGIARSLVADRAGSALFTLLLMGILVLEFGSLWILHLEQYAPDANITSASDALWYVIVTNFHGGLRRPISGD